MLRKTKLQCGHVIEVRENTTATWCPFCGDVVDVAAPVPDQPVVAASARR